MIAAGYVQFYLIVILNHSFRLSQDPVSPTAGEFLHLSSSFLGRNEEELRNWGATISGNCHLRLAIATGGTGYHRIGGEGCSQHFLALRFFPH